MSNQRVDILRMTAVSHVYNIEACPVTVLQNINLEVPAGQIVSIIGHSGSGKSTLLAIAGMLLSPTSGTIEICGLRQGRLGSKANRASNVGFVYQSPFLLNDFTAVENVSLPLVLVGKSRGMAAQIAAKLLDQFGLSSRANQMPSQLSGGERQRVAIARALAASPKLVLADEPTANLNKEQSRQVMDYLLGFIRGSGSSCIVATHDASLATMCDATYTIESGVLTKVKVGREW